MQFYFPESKSVLQAQMMVDWKRNRSAYNFQALPDTAIICVDHGVLRHLESFRTKKIKGLKGKSFIRHKLLFCSGFDNGGPGILNLLEELSALGVRRFVYIGLAGRIVPSLAEASISLVEKTISGSGCTLYYHDQQVIEPFDRTFCNNLKEALQVSACTCFSTDAPFRETKPVLEQAIAAGAGLIEMECAAIYSFAHFYKVQASCFLIAADDLSNGWKAPENWGQLIKAQRNFVDRLIKTLS